MSIKENKKIKKVISENPFLSQSSIADETNTTLYKVQYFLENNDLKLTDLRKIYAKKSDIKLNLDKYKKDHQYNHETKTDKIIDLIAENPFSTLNDIAKKIDSSNNYVRTILSNNDLSLRKLRKEYKTMVKESDFKINLNEIINERV